MSLRVELAAIVRGMPEGSAVSLPVEWLRGLLEAEPSGGDEPDQLLTLEQIAEIAGRSISTVRSWCNSGQIEGAFRLHGREWRIPSGAWRRHLESLQSDVEDARMVQHRPADLGSWRRNRRKGGGR